MYVCIYVCILHTSQLNLRFRWILCCIVPATATCCVSACSCFDAAYCLRMPQRADGVNVAHIFPHLCLLFLSTAAYFAAAQRISFHTHLWIREIIITSQYCFARRFFDLIYLKLAKGHEQFFAFNVWYALMVVTLVGPRNVGQDFFVFLLFYYSAAFCHVNCVNARSFLWLLVFI